MDYVKPPEVVKALLTAGAMKAGLAPRDLLLRGVLSGALLGFATSLALLATLQTGQPIVGALVFPVGFVMIVLLGLELVTGNFASVTVAGVDRRCSWSAVASNLAWVFLGNLVGSVLYGALLAGALTSFGTEAPSPLVAKLVTLAEAKTLGYAAHGAAGMGAVVTKAVLCNWMVCLGVVMAFTSHSTLGKIVAAWLPVVTFFGQGFEHSVVNMFVIPTGMLLGAKVSVAQWWAWNQVPVTLGNFVGGCLFTGLFLYWTYRPAAAAAPAPVVEALPPEPAREPARA